MRNSTPKQPPESADASEFRAAVKDAKPLEPRVIPDGIAKRKPAPRRRVEPPAIRGSNESQAPPALDAPVGAEESLSFRRGGVQDRVVRKLRRGLIPVQAEIDLHGLTQSAAWDALEEFLAQSRLRGWRCVRVIHGKGHRSAIGSPVLKSAVNTWLRRHHDVIAFTSARAIDGGGGALYVLLRA